MWKKPGGCQQMPSIGGLRITTILLAVLLCAASAFAQTAGRVLGRTVDQTLFRAPSIA
jgi:hypothetical protein